MRNLLISTLLILASGVIAHSQAVRVTTEIGPGYTFYTNSAGDSLYVKNGNNGVPIPYSGQSYPSLNGCFPDSIRVSSNAVTDTVVGKIYFKAWINLGYANTSRDSVADITAHGFKSVPVTRSLYQGKDFMDLAYSAKSTTNGTTSGNTLYFRIERFFTLPKSQ